MLIDLAAFIEKGKFTLMILFILRAIGWYFKKRYLKITHRYYLYVDNKN